MRSDTTVARSSPPDGAAIVVDKPSLIVFFFYCSSWYTTRRSQMDRQLAIGEMEAVPVGYPFVNFLYKYSSSPALSFILAAWIWISGLCDQLSASPVYSRHQYDNCNTRLYLVQNLRCSQKAARPRSIQVPFVSHHQLKVQKTARHVVY